MTARQQRRLKQKLARKAAKKQLNQEHPEVSQAASAVGQAVVPARDSLVPQVHQPVSEAKLVANRANAQLSTGPTSDAGKQVASQNSTRHGLSGSNFRVLPDESQSDFDRLRNALLRDEAPVSSAEIEMVEQMAQALWLSRRSLRLQDKCLMEMNCGEPARERAAAKELGLYLRYQTAHDRAFIRFSVELRKCRNERRRIERGFVSQKLRDAREQRQKERDEIRRAIEKCKQERHDMKMRLDRAKCERLEGAPKALSAAA